MVPDLCLVYFSCGNPPNPKGVGKGPQPKKGWERAPLGDSAPPLFGKLVLKDWIALTFVEQKVEPVVDLMDMPPNFKRSKRACSARACLGNDTSENRVRVGMAPSSEYYSFRKGSRTITQPVTVSSFCSPSGVFRMSTQLKNKQKKQGSSRPWLNFAKFQP